MMAKKGKGGFKAYLRGAIHFSLNLGTLAQQTLISGTVGDSVTEKAYCSSVVATYSLDEMTTAAGDGPIVVGVAHSDYTDAEIEAWFENTGSWEQGDLVQNKEIGRRLCKVVGTFRNPQDSTDSWPLNDGRKIKTRLGWMLTTGQTLRFWAYNSGTSALATTDPQVNVEGHANLWPR